MRRLSPRFLVPMLLAFSSMIYAGSDNTEIAIEITQVEYLNLIGSAAGADKLLDANDIRPATKNGPNPTVSLGTLGLESSVTGSCTLDFVSLTGFKLKHSQGNQVFTSYQLDYEGTTIDPTNLTMVLPSCIIAPTSLDFTATSKIKKKIRAGIYSDTVTITVTSQ